MADKNKANGENNNKKNGGLPVVIGAAAAFVILVIILALVLSKCGKTNDPAATNQLTAADTGSQGAETEAPGTSSGEQSGDPVHVHAFGEWTVLSEPACLTAGERERVCASCGEKQTEELPPLGHDGHNNECVRCGKKANVGDFKLSADKENPDAYMIDNCYAAEEDVLIPDVYEGKPVVRVRYQSFSNTEVKYVSIPDSVETVESWALAYMPNLELVRIGKNVGSLDPTFRFWTDSLRWLYVEPGNERYHSYCNCIIETATKTLISGCGGSVLPDDGSVTVIANASLSNVRNLERLNIPDSVTAIAEYSMNNCYGLLSLEIPDSVTEIGQYAFDACKGLQNLRLPAGLTEMGLGWFRGCVSLSAVVLPEGVTDTGVSCFEDCELLKTVTLPEKLQRIGNYTFKNCTSLEEIKLPQSLTKLGDAFAGCTGLKKLVIPDGVDDPGVSVISHCTGLKEIVLPKDMAGIPYHFFGECSSLETVVIPPKVTQIEYNAFKNCTSLKSVVFPASLKFIQNDIFVNCPALETVYYEGSEADWAKISINSSNETLNKAKIVYNYKG